MNRILRTVIVDDDPTIRKSLSILCGKSVDIDLISIFSSGLEALSFLKSNEIDLILIDLDMPVLSGWEVIELLPYKPIVVVISSKKNQANLGYKFEIFDFIVKPVYVSDFLKMVERTVVKFKENQPSDTIYLKSNGKYEKLKLEDILYLQAMSDYVKVILPNKKLTVHSTLKSILEKLPSESFFQVHRSYVINLKKIDQVLAQDVVISGKEVPISKSNSQALFKKLNIT